MDPNEPDDEKASEAMRISDEASEVLDRGDFDQAEAIAHRALRLAEESGSFVAMIHALLPLGQLWFGRRETAKALKCWRRIRYLAQESGMKDVAASMAALLAAVGPAREGFASDSRGPPPKFSDWFSGSDGKPSVADEACKYLVTAFCLAIDIFRSCFVGGVNPDLLLERVLDEVDAQSEGAWRLSVEKLAGASDVVFDAVELLNCTPEELREHAGDDSDLASLQTHRAALLFAAGREKEALKAIVEARKTAVRSHFAEPVLVCLFCQIQLLVETGNFILAGITLHTLQQTMAGLDVDSHVLLDALDNQIPRSDGGPG